MGLVDYISRNPFAKAEKVSTYDEHFVVATISKIRNSMKHLVRDKQNTIQNLNSILKLKSPSSKLNQLIAPLMHISLNINSQFSTKPVASKSLQYSKKLSFAPQLTLSNSIVNPPLNIPFASQMPLQNTKSEIAQNNFTTNNSHSINKFAAKAVQNSNGKECEQLCRIKFINGIKSNNPPKYSKLSAKTQFPKYKYHWHKNNSLFAQNKFRIQSSSNNSVKSINSINPVHSINNMPKTKANKSTPTKARVSFSDTIPRRHPQQIRHRIRKPLHQAV